jgi:ribose transport system substrate-binding protein
MKLVSLLASLCLLLAMIGCGDSGSSSSSATQAASGKRKIVIGLVAKSQSNDVFQAAYSGAKDAAKSLGEKYNADVTIDWRTPVSEDAAKQVENVDALIRAGVQGIAVSCTDGDTLKLAIDRAVEAGIPVMTFDSDSPRSKRFAYYGSDHAMVGQVIMRSLAKSMNEEGTVAILGGNQSGTNLQIRVNAAKEELKKYPKMKLLEASGGVFYHEETPEKAAEAVATATNVNPGIQGWCFIGGWPLFTVNALKWEPGTIKVASCDALPAQLGYLKSGHVQTLFAQDCYGWGEKSVATLLEKIVNGKSPADPIMVDPLTQVTKENADAYGKNWEKWLGK